MQRPAYVVRAAQAGVLDGIRRGYTVAEATGREGLTVKAWDAWRRRHPEFREAAAAAFAERRHRDRANREQIRRLNAGEIVLDLPTVTELRKAREAKERVIEPEPVPTLPRLPTCRMCGEPTIPIASGRRCVACGLVTSSA